MDESVKILSDITVYNKYAKYIPELKRRESWEEIVLRDVKMNVSKFPQLESEIYEAFSSVLDKKVLPSMRTLQFAGLPIEINNTRNYNCSFAAINNIKVFSEAMFLLLSGCGFSYSVQKHHIEKLPELKGPLNRKRNYLIEDSIIGWADTIKMLIDSYFNGKSYPVFDYRDIRPKGSKLVTSGGKAPGPLPLKECVFNIQKILDNALETRGIGTKLKTIEAHDIMCFIADAVLTGGIRRAACLAGFSFDDEEMLSCKTGDWYEKNPQRQRANNSVVLLKRKIDKKSFDYIFDFIENSQYGEPGIIISNDKDYMFNPCVSGDTEIFTREGYQRIDSLIGKETEIWNGFEWSSVTPKITGYDQPMLNVKFSDGRSLKCTDYHKFHISKDYRENNEIIKAVDLKIGDKIIKYDFPKIITNPVEQDKLEYTKGFYCAEGSTDERIIHVYEPKYMCFDRLIGSVGSKQSNINGVERTTFNLSKDEEWKKNYIPFNKSINKIVSWLSGLFDGDGCELKEGGLQLSSIDPIFLKDLQKILSVIGVNSKIVFGNKEGMRNLPDGNGGLKKYFCKECNRICIGATQMQYLKSLGLDCARMKFDKTPQRDASQFTRVVSIERIENEEIVYCFNEPKNHTGIFNGILTGQCGEASLKSETFCNLTTINMSDVIDQNDFNERAKHAAFIGTLQAAYTNFHYLRECWKTNTEKDSLLGVSMTGLASKSVLSLDFKQAAEVVKKENERVSAILGINKAARTTLIKPEGTASIVLGCSNGVHSWHSPYYIRRIRMNKDEPLYLYLNSIIPEMIEDEYFKPKNTAVLSMPVKAPDDAITRSNESSIDLINRCIKINKEWIKTGHRSGANTHNVSATISIKDEEWKDVREHIWNNLDYINGMTFFKYDGGKYIQAPFEECSKETYDTMMSKVKSIDLYKIVEEENMVDHKQIIACAGGACEIS